MRLLLCNPRNIISAETPYESRYFSVLLDGHGNIIHTETSKIVAIDSNTAEQYAYYAVKKTRQKGFVGNYRYNKNYEGTSVRIIFVDFGRKLDGFYT